VLRSDENSSKPVSAPIIRKAQNVLLFRGTAALPV
jgi:hypothetical protein